VASDWWQVVIGYWLLVVGCWKQLLTIGYWPLVIALIAAMEEELLTRGRTATLETQSGTKQ